VTTKVTLPDLKKIVEEHMKEELDIMEIILDLDKNTVEEFTKWYISHPYCKGIEELREIVGRRTNQQNKGYSSSIIGPINKENSN
jgi:hypothetical protein